MGQMRHRHTLGIWSHTQLRHNSMFFIRLRPKCQSKFKLHLDDLANIYKKNIQ